MGGVLSAATLSSYTDCYNWDESFGYFRKLHCHCLSILSSARANLVYMFAERLGLTAHAPKMASLWYNLPNYLSSNMRWEKAVLFSFFFSFCCTCHSNSCIYSNRQLPLHTSPIFFFPCLSLSFFSLLNAGQVSLNYSSVRNEKSSWILNILSEVAANCASFCAFLHFFFLLLKKKGVADLMLGYFKG